MGKDTADEHYEETFEFPLWRLIKQRAEEKDISYAEASGEVLPDYVKTIRYRDTAFEKEEIEKRQRELVEMTLRMQKEGKD